MKNNYNKIIAFVLLALISVSSQALLYKNDYFVWTYFNVAEDNAGMGELALAIPGLKALSRTDTAQFWNSGEPNNSSSIEHCVTQSKNGGWNDTKCDAAHQLACFNGTSWALSPSTVNIQNNVWSTSPPTGCPLGYSFAAPMTVEQKLALDVVIPSGGTVWINGFDNDRGMYPPGSPAPSAKEGVWVFNRGITNLFGPNWAVGQPETNSAKNCASINASGQWTVESCSAQRALVCARQDFGAVQIVNANTAFTNIEAMHKICRTQVSLPGEQWMLAAPRSSAENAAVVAAFSGSGVTGSAWLNASGNRAGNTWQTNLDLTNWAAGEPNLTKGQCVVTRATDGKWQMADCDSRAKLLCSDGVTWRVRSAEHQFSNQAIEACSRPDGPKDTANLYSTYQLITPITEYDRHRAELAVRAGTGLYWLNLKYLTDTQTWLRNSNYKPAEFNGSNPQKAVWYHTLRDGNNERLHNGSLTEYYTGATLSIDGALERNKGVTVYFTSKEPNGSEDTNRSSCIQLYTSGANAGLWDDTRCDNNSKRVACFDGFEWAISPDATSLGANNQNPENVSAGHNACAAVEKNGVKGNFVFAAPRSFAQSQKLLTVALDSGADNVWINLNSKKYKRAYVFNLGANVIAPFWNPEEPNNAGAGEDCAVQQDTGNWNDLACSSTQRVACYSPYEGTNGTWKLTAASYTYSDTNTLTKQCETEHGAQYKFYAPETLSQMRDLKTVMGATANAYINANDIQYEGSWVMNQGINNWAAGQQPYANDGKSCVSASAKTGQWITQNCANQLPVACYTGGSWIFTSAKVKLDNFANGQAACSAEFGQGYIFQAPRSLEAAEQLQHSAELVGVSGDYWINGNSLETHTAWKWNQISLNTPIWGAGQPDGGSKHNCALLNNNTQGSWQDALCDQAANVAYLCRNGNQWQASTQLGNLQDFSTATAACNNLGAGWVFVAPTTYNENVAAKNAIAQAGVSQVWLNATDSIKEAAWILNSAPATNYPNWAASLPAGNCAYQSEAGTLHTIDCASSEENAWSCTNGYKWSVTTAKGKVGTFSDGHKACLNEFGSDFIFAAPLSKNDAIKLDFARLLTAKESNTSVNKVWLNMTTGGNAQLSTGEGRMFRRNLPFTNWSGLLAGKEPSFDQCAYKGSAASGANNPWLIASCTGFSAHYACTNGSQWRVATSKGKIENGTIQIVPTEKDYWSYERGNSMCKEQFGGSYYFSAPVTAAEELALDASIRSTDTQANRVWLNTYGVSSLSGVDNKWFVNRLHLGVWQKPEFRNYNNSDCSILHPDGSWTDVSCKNNPTKYAFACFNGEWSVTGNGNWEQGFEACASSSASMFAVPRTPDEMAALQFKMGVDPVWINLTDTAYESQWIANRLRFAWWAAGEPSNVGNRDCARVRKGTGQWYAGKCSIEAAPFACRTASGSNVTWNVTASEGIWSDGFGACEREFPGSLFMAPEGFGTVSANNDQDVLYSVINTAAKDAWINLSDQDVEGSWRAHRAFADWGVSSLFDENQDCAFLDRNNTSGTWLADSCRYTASTSQSRGYACTDGYQWKIVNETATTDMRWSGGFAACQNLGANWRFAAPTNAFENTKLKLAMELHTTEQNQIWINAHDRFVEGEWQLNGPETNFAPTIDASATAVKVSENQTNVLLSAALSDDEEQGIASASWTLVSNIGAINGTVYNDITVSASQLTSGTNGSGTVTAQYSTPVLFKEDRILKFKVTATDVPVGTATAATSESFVQVRVLGPLVAAWDFNNLSVANKDITGRGHDAISSSMPQVVVQDGNGVLKLESSSQMVVPGKAADPINGLEYPADTYTIAFRMSIENPAQPNDGFRGILQKGDTGSDRQPGLSLVGKVGANNASDKLSVSQSITPSGSAWPYRDTNTGSELNTLQWVNVVYVESLTGTKVYLDGVEVVSAAVNPSRPSLQNNGNFYVGNLPHVGGGSFIGYIDDIHIYNRDLSQAEREQVLPAPPLGTVQFTAASVTTDEYLPSPSTHAVQLERTRGNNSALTVYVDFDQANSTATKGTVADMTNASHPADFAFVDEASYVTGKGIPVTWAVGEKGVKSVSLKLDNADDGIREGTETARFEIKELSGSQAGENKTHVLRLIDLTPNIHGNFSVSIDGLSSKRVSEDSGSQEICFVRESGTTGQVSLSYQFTTNAVLGTDYNYGTGSIIPAGTEDTVTFNAGDGVNKCIIIDPIFNATVGDADKTYSVVITAMNHDSAIEPLLTEQKNASLVVYDFSPGTFGFNAHVYSCKEPNDSLLVPESIRAKLADMQCSIAVTRTNTGLTAPAATLNVSHVNSYEGGITYTYNSTLQWPEISAANPKVLEDETQYINVIIANNNVQNPDLEVTFILASNSIEILDSAKSAAILNISDITEPALVQLTRSKDEMNEGESVIYTITRTGNANTEFSFDYKVTRTPDMSKAYSHFFNTSTGAGESARLSFTKGGVNTHTLTFNSIDTPENNQNFNMQVALDRPDNDNIVGFGLLNNAGTGINGNKTLALTNVKNTRDLIADNYSILFHDAGTDSGKAQDRSFTHSGGALGTAPDYLTAYKIQVPTTRQLHISLKVPKGLHIDSGTNFTWKLLTEKEVNGNLVWDNATWSDGISVQSNPNGRFEEGRSGSIAYDAAGVNKTQDYSTTAKLNIPFVVEETKFRLQLDINGNTEVFSKTIEFTVRPLYRRLKNDANNRCLRGHLTETLVGCGNKDQWPDLYWIWHSEKSFLISLYSVQNNEAAKCIDIPSTSALNTTNARMRECTVTGNRIATLHSDKTFRIDGTTTCRYSLNNDKIMRKSGCSDNDDRKWTWED